MKKLVYFFSIFVLISSFSFAQTLYTTVWEKSKSKTNYPKYLDSTGNLTRCLSYGKVGGNDRVYVCSRNNTHNVFILNAATGDSVGKLDMTGVGGGTYNLNDVEVSSDGVIFACNLALGTGSDTVFAIYKWNSETAAPVKVIAYKGPGRLGDKFTVVGSTADNSLTIYAACASLDKVVKFTTNDNGASFTPQIITLSNGASGSSPSVGPVGLGASDFYLKSVGKSLYKFSSTGAIIDTVSGGLIATGSSAVRAFTAGSNKYVAVYNYGTGNENIRMLEVTNGDPQARLVFVTSSLGASSNANGTGDISFKDNGDGTFNLLVLGTNNGIGYYQTRDLRGLSPFTVPMDGLNMFTEGCNLMQKGSMSNHYFAFDKDYLYFGFAHYPFHLDTLDVRVWIDTNPSIDNGASAASWGAPAFDSTYYKPNYAVYLENGFYSEIRKWAGSSWSGDLGFVGSADRYGGWSGNGYFSELRVRRDSIGNPSAIAYAVTMEKEDNSGIYGAFPAENKTSNIKYFYVINNLGSGVCARSFNSPLIPVELASFTANTFGKGIILNWTTATEKNNAGFAVERSGNAKDFTAISYINGNGTTAEIHNYSFTDNNVSAGKYFYRLKQIDYDGTANYSKTVEVNVVSVPAVFALRQNFPNPFNPTTNIKFTVAQNGIASLKVFNTLGQEVMSLFNGSAEAGKIYDVTFNASKLTSGVYFYQLKQGNNIESKKMMLIK
jgi:hypothetical protein